MVADASNYSVVFRDVRHPRLEFKTGRLLVVLPRDESTPKQTIEKYREWIKRKQQIIDDALREASSMSLDTERSEGQLKTLAGQLSKFAQVTLNVSVNRLHFRKMRTKWASHTKENNLTLNTLLKYLPDELIEYVVYHEVAHCLERKHNSQFWQLIFKKFPGYDEKEKDLLTYWFLVQKKVGTNNANV